jgi:hypothetical protein
MILPTVATEKFYAKNFVLMAPKDAALNYQIKMTFLWTKPRDVAKVWVAPLLPPLPQPEPKQPGINLQGPFSKVIAHASSPKVNLDVFLRTFS